MMAQGPIISSDGINFTDMARHMGKTSITSSPTAPKFYYSIPQAQLLSEMITHPEYSVELSRKIGSQKVNLIQEQLKVLLNSQTNADDLAKAQTELARLIDDAKSKGLVFEHAPLTSPDNYHKTLFEGSDSVNFSHNNKFKEINYPDGIDIEKVNEIVAKQKPGLESYYNFELLDQRRNWFRRIDKINHDPELLAYANTNTYTINGQSRPISELAGYKNFKKIKQLDDKLLEWENLEFDNKQQAIAGVQKTKNKLIEKAFAERELLDRTSNISSSTVQNYDKTSKFSFNRNGNTASFDPQQLAHYARNEGGLHSTRYAYQAQEANEQFLELTKGELRNFLDTDKVRLLEQKRNYLAAQALDMSEHSDMLNSTFTYRNRYTGKFDESFKLSQIAGADNFSKIQSQYEKILELRNSGKDIDPGIWKSFDTEVHKALKQNRLMQSGLFKQTQGQLIVGDKTLELTTFSNQPKALEEILELQDRIKGLEKAGDSVSDAQQLKRAAEKQLAEAVKKAESNTRKNLVKSAQGTVGAKGSRGGWFGSVADTTEEILTDERGVLVSASEKAKDSVQGLYKTLDSFEDGLGDKNVIKRLGKWLGQFGDEAAGMGKAFKFLGTAGNVLAGVMAFLDFKNGETVNGIGKVAGMLVGFATVGAVVLTGGGLLATAASLALSVGIGLGAEWAARNVARFLGFKNKSEQQAMAQQGANPFAMAGAGYDSGNGMLDMSNEKFAKHVENWTQGNF